MARYQPLQRSFGRMVRDVPRDQMPKDACWNLIDYIPEVIGSPIRKRGGWAHGSNALGAGAYAAAVAYADFSGGSQLVIINDAGTLYKMTPSGTSVTSVTGAVVPTSPMAQHRDLLVIPSNDGTAAVKSFDGTSVSNLAATAPAGMHTAVYKDRTLLARIAGNLQRVYFGPAGIPSGTWDTTNSYIDASFPVTGLAALRNVIIVFGSGRTERIRGNTPPPNSDMVREPLFNIGCIDARSIVGFGDSVIFANQEGVWITDGSIPENLIKSGGMLTYWIDTLASYTSSWTLAAGIHRSIYFISIMNGATFVDCLACDLERRAWFRLTNVKATMFAKSLGTAEELWWGRRDTARCGKLAGSFSPGGTIYNDGDGTAVTPTLETPFYLGSPATKKRLHDVYTDYALVAASTVAALQLAYVTTPDDTSYTDLASTLPEQAQVDRKRLPLRFAARGIGLKITQTAASDDTRLHEIGLTVSTQEQSR